MTLKTTLCKFTKAELIDFMLEYNKYIIGFMDLHGACESGSIPVCLGEFNDCEYELILEERGK